MNEEAMAHRGLLSGKKRALKRKGPQRPSLIWYVALVMFNKL